MATVKTAYSGASPTAITITLNGLGSGSARQATAVDNITSTLYEDVLLEGTFITASGSLGSNPVINVWVAASLDGTNYNGGASGTDAAYTMPTNTGNLVLAAVVPINTAASAEVMPPVSVATLFGGELPPHWTVIVQNSSGLALGSSGNSMSFTGINRTIA